MFSYSIAPSAYKTVSGTTTCFSHELNIKNGKKLSLCGIPGEEINGNVIIGSDEPYILLLDESYYVSQYGQFDTVRLHGNNILFRYVKKVKDDDNFEKADIICEDSFIELPAGSFSQIYFSFVIPENAKPGKYTKKIEIFCGDKNEKETKAGEVSFEYRVYKPENDFENSFFTDIWLHPTHIARAHNVALWSEEHFSIIDRYVYALSKLNQKSVTLIMSEIPWRGQFCNTERRFRANMFEYSMVKVYRAGNRKFVYDFSAVDKILSIYNKYNCDDEIAVYGLSGVWDGLMPEKRKSEHPDGILVRFTDKRDGKARFMTNPSDIDNYIKAVEKYFVSKSLAGKVRLVADEPSDIKRYTEIVNRIKKIAPSFKFKSAICSLDFVNSFSDFLTDFAPSLKVLSNEYDDLMKIKKEKPESRMLYYVCWNPPFPNTFIRSNLCESFVLPIIASIADIDGFLRWSFTCWPDNPDTDPRYFAWPAGDTFMVYPGKHGGPLLSLRYENLKKGIALYGLLEELKKRRGSKTYNQALEYVIREKDIRKVLSHNSPDDVFSPDFGDYEKMKEFILQNL